MGRKQLTLMIIVDEENQKILLGMKKRGFGCGWWNGFGGKLKSNETIEECVKRETLEESGLTIDDMWKIGHIVFEFQNDPVLLDVHIFYSSKYSGNVKETEEMKPQWFKFDDIPYDKMWPDDELWYPYVFEKKRFQGYFLFEGHTKILESKLEAVKEFSLPS